MAKSIRCTLDLSTIDSARLERLCKEREVTKAQLLRDALNLYNLLHERAKNGSIIYIVDSDDEKHEVYFK